MFFRLHSPAPKERACWALNLKRIAAAVAFVGIFAFTGCGGGPSPTKLSPSKAPTGNLTIAASLPAGTEGSTYNGNVKATGGTSPYNYAVVWGQMPQGVNLDAKSGSVSGTPSATGSFNFAVSVSDASGNSKEQSLQIAVANAPAAPVPTPAPTNPPPSNPPPSTPPPSNPPASNPPANNPAPSNPQPTNNSSEGNAFSNLQASGGWAQYGQGPPNFVDCSPSPCNGIEFSMSQNQSSPSLSGHSTVYWVGGSTPYSDALWNNHLIGDGSSQGMDDSDQSIVPKIQNFTYDVDFYGDNLGAAEALEFDINQFFGGMGFIFGHECRVAGGNQWDIWDNSKGRWIPTGIPCYPKSGDWNHLTIKVQRTSDNHEAYQSITLNGQTANLNWTFEKGSAGNWYGVTVNFQLDGNYKQDGYKVYLDNLTLNYQ